MDLGELRIRSRAFLRTCGFIVLFNAVVLASAWAEVFLPLPKFIGMVFSLVGVAGVFVLVAAAFVPLGALGMSLMAIFRRDVRSALPAMLVLGLVGFATSVPTGIAGFMIWDAGFRKIARDSGPLVQAIRKYEADHGKPPADLEALVREKYLADIPSTPCGCSEYRISKGSRENPWELKVIPPFRGIGFDRFEYWPKQNYPLRGDSGWYEPVGDWVYYHE